MLDQGITVDQLVPIPLNRLIQGSFGVGFLGFRPVPRLPRTGHFFTCIKLQG